MVCNELCLVVVYCVHSVVTCGHGLCKDRHLRSVVVELYEIVTFFDAT